MMIQSMWCSWQIWCFGYPSIIVAFAAASLAAASLAASLAASVAAAASLAALLLSVTVESDPIV